MAAPFTNQQRQPYHKPFIEGEATMNTHRLTNRAEFVNRLDSVANPTHLRYEVRHDGAIVWFRADNSPICDFDVGFVAYGAGVDHESLVGEPMRLGWLYARGEDMYEREMMSEPGYPYDTDNEPGYWESIRPDWF